MRQRSFILLATLLAALIFGSVGVYAYDSARDDEIAEGITAAGIDLGGLKDDAAREKLRSELTYDLERPLRVKYRGRSVKLDARRAGIRVDVDAMVDDALDRTRDGNLVTRSVRAITGGEVHAEVPAQVSYSGAAVGAFVRRVKRQLDRPARDASISYSGGGIVPVRGRNGHAVDRERLADDVRAALVEPASTRVVRPRVTVTKPKVTTGELASRYPKVITVDRTAKVLRLYVNLKQAATYPIAVGQVGLETPAGQYQIQDKQVNPAWHVPNSDWAGKLAGRVIPGGVPSNPLRARWMGIYGGAGIHGTTDIGSLGTAASHGCIRMSVPNVIELYDRVDVGTPVFIS
ncbi:MAG TPA: L,D-transpeptidase/peptidoglycan binding protein [Thermoleophilaceae bacterium]|jgi:lipoprotein-anchoring transpeptidase ErfK/SrfK